MFYDYIRENCDLTPVYYELQSDLDGWLDYYNNERTHQGKRCCGRTPMDTLTDGKTIWKEKFMN